MSRYLVHCQTLNAWQPLAVPRLLGAWGALGGLGHLRPLTCVGIGSTLGPQPGADAQRGSARQAAPLSVGPTGGAHRNGDKTTSRPS